MKEIEILEKDSVDPYYCVVCTKTSIDTPFNCRYRVHERNEIVLSQFFEKELQNGQLCDRCYRKWYKYKREQIKARDGSSKFTLDSIPNGKRKRAKSPQNDKKESLIYIDGNGYMDSKHSRIEENVVIHLRKMPRRPHLEQNLNSVGSDDTDSAFLNDYQNYFPISSGHLYQETGHPSSNSVHLSSESYQQSEMNRSNIITEMSGFDNSFCTHVDTIQLPKSSIIHSNSYKSQLFNEKNVGRIIEHSFQNHLEGEDLCNHQHTFQDVVQNFNISLEQAKQIARKPRDNIQSKKLSQNKSSIIEYFQKKEIEARKSKRKGLPRRAYQANTFHLLHVPNEVYLLDENTTSYAI